MKDRSCARCDWRPDADDKVPGRVQAIEHAEASGHWLCSVCTFSLDPTEPIVCERCLSNAQRRLAEVVEQYALLPAELSHPSAHAALVLLGPGSDGMASRDMTPREWQRLAGARPHRLGLPGREHRTDNREGDGTSVAYVLSNWEADWRETRGEPPAAGPATVVGAAGYLERRMRSAANGDSDHDPHPAFADFAVELADLLDEMESAGHRDDRPERAPVACFDCGASKALRRVYRKPDPCEHARPPFPPATRVERDAEGELIEVRVPIAERRARHDADLKRWRSDHARCDQGGLVPLWTCRICDRKYTDAEYMLALKDSMLAVARSSGWGMVWEVATSLGVPVRTVRSWVDRMQVTSACSVDTQRVIVWWPDARDRAAESVARRHKREAAQAKRAAAQADTTASSA